MKTETITQTNQKGARKEGGRVRKEEWEWKGERMGEGGNGRRQCVKSLSCCHADCQAACQASVSVGGLPETTSKWTTTGCRSARKTNIYIHTHICIRYIHMCVCVRWGHNMRDNLMSTPWRSLLLCPRRNVLIKIKRNFFDFDFIKCDLNELGHIFPQHTHTRTYISTLCVSVCNAD